MAANVGTNCFCSPPSDVPHILGVKGSRDLSPLSAMKVSGTFIAMTPCQNSSLHSAAG